MEFDCANKNAQNAKHCFIASYVSAKNIGAVKLHFGRTLVGSVAHLCGFLAQ